MPLVSVNDDPAAMQHAPIPLELPSTDVPPDGHAVHVIDEPEPALL